MIEWPLTERIVEGFDGMSKQLQLAARYILEHPRDVALLSMREQARHAGIQPATMTRLAKHLGFDGYERISEAYAAAIRGNETGFTRKASAASSKQQADKGLAAEMLQSLARQVELLREPGALARLAAAAKLLAKAKHVYCVSLRSMHPVAWHFHYIMTLIGRRSTLLDAIGATGTDAFRYATPDDVLLAATVLPYTRATLEIAELAKARNIPVVAITDSLISPLAATARQVVLVPTESPNFFHAMSPAFIAAEILAALVAAQNAGKTLDALKIVDDHLQTLGTHTQPLT